MDVEDYAGAIGQCHRVLRDGGAPVSHWIRDGFERVAWQDKIAKQFRAPVLRRHRRWSTTSLVRCVQDSSSRNCGCRRVLKKSPAYPIFFSCHG